MMKTRLGIDFFCREVLEVAPELVGKVLIRSNDGIRIAHIITEVEAYRGVEDLACHASKGRTPRTEVMFQQGGLVYVYFIYGMYWMLNFVTGKKDDPQAVLIRGISECYGPGRLTKKLNITGEFYGENLHESSRLWVEDHGNSPIIKRATRIGVEYAGEEWASKPWRFFTEEYK